MSTSLLPGAEEDEEEDDDELGSCAFASPAVIKARRATAERQRFKDDDKNGDEITIKVRRTRQVYGSVGIVRNVALNSDA
jgi:hypothetical protein